MTTYLLLKLCKLLAVAALFSGTIGAVFARDLGDRQRFAYWLAGPGFGLAWVLGFLLAYVMGVGFLRFWVICALVLSLFSLQVVLFAVGREGRRSATVATLALAPLVATVALMLWKPVLSPD